MSFSSRALTRVLVIGAVVALTGSLGALPVAGQDATDEQPGPAVPGLTVAAVSGEAFGGEAEETITVDATLTSLDVQALTAAAIAGDSAAVSTLLKDAGIDVSAAASAAAITTLHGEVGPDPEVELPSDGGGPVKDSEGKLNLTIDGATSTVAEDLEVETQGATGPTGYARTEAKAENVDTFGLYFADKIETECSADLEGARGSTRIEDGQVTDFDPLDLVDIPEHPDKNEVLVDGTFDLAFPPLPSAPTGIFRVTAFLIVNEQDKDDNSITVTGARERFKLEAIDTTGRAPVLRGTLVGESTFAQSHCDIHADPVVQVVEPKFTG